MQYKIIDETFGFVSAFDTETGAYVRTGILDESGRDTGVDPFMASFPHLIDVGVMGHCIHGKTGLCLKAGIGCYQSGPLVDEPNMPIVFVSSSGFQLRQRFFSHVARKGFRFGKGVPLSLFGFAS